jgi:hypothetical protein
MEKHCECAKCDSEGKIWESHKKEDDEYVEYKQEDDDRQ